MCVCVCVCVCEREREREIVCVEDFKTLGRQYSPRVKLRQNNMRKREKEKRHKIQEGEKYRKRRRYNLKEDIKRNTKKENQRERDCEK